MKKQKKERFNDEKEIDKKIDLVNKSQLQRTEKFSSGKIRDGIYVQLMSNYEVDLVELKANKVELGNYKKDLDKFIAFSLTLSSNLDLFYKNASYRNENKYYRFVIHKKVRIF